MSVPPPAFALFVAPGQKPVGIKEPGELISTNNKQLHALSRLALRSVESLPLPISSTVLVLYQVRYLVRGGTVPLVIVDCRAQ
jgi:hypothetical protein